MKFLKNKIKYVINLAAQAGVRYSIKYPQSTLILILMVFLIF